MARGASTHGRCSLISNDLVPVFGCGNGLNVIILASEAATVEVWTKIISAEFRERLRQERPIDGSPVWHLPVTLLPSKAESAFENFLRRVALSNYIISTFRFIDVTIREIVKAIDRPASAQATADYTAEVDYDADVQRKIGYTMVTHMITALETFGERFADILTDYEKGMLMEGMPSCLRAMQQVGASILEREGKSTDYARGFVDLVTIVWKLRAFSADEQPDIQRGTPVDMALKTDIDIRATGEERAILVKHKELCKGLGVEVDVEQLRDPFFEAHDLDLNPPESVKLHKHVRTGKAAGWQRREMAKQGRENGWGNRGHGQEGSSRRWDAWQAKRAVSDPPN